MKRLLLFITLCTTFILVFGQTQTEPSGRYRIRVKGKYGFIDKTGKTVIKPQFDGAMYFSDGLAGVEIDGKMGFIDKTGKIVIQPQFDYCGDFREGLARIEIGGKVKYIDKSGKVVWQPTK